MLSLDETCCVSSCVVRRRVAALNFIFPALTTPLSAQAFLGYDVLRNHHVQDAIRNISHQKSENTRNLARQHVLTKIVQAPMLRLIAQEEANPAPPEPKQDKAEKKCSRKRQWTSEEANMEMCGKAVKMMSKIESILDKFDSHNSDED